MRDALRLACGTLSLLPIRPPTRTGRDVWRWAILLAPLVGLVLGLLALALSWTLTQAGGSPTLSAVAVVAVLAALTRGLHLDGLADVADGLGSRKPPDEARAVMRRSDIGPFGVITLLFVLLMQVAALGQLLADDPRAAAAGVLGASVLSRAMLTWTCRSGVLAADTVGLGAAVAESVPKVVAGLVLAGCAIAIVALGAAGRHGLLLPAAVAVAVGIVVSELWRRHCTRRLGGLTGDVLGATEQITWTTFVVAFALA